MTVVFSQACDSARDTDKRGNGDKMENANRVTIAGQYPNPIQPRNPHKLMKHLRSGSLSMSQLVTSIIGTYINSSLERYESTWRSS